MKLYIATHGKHQKSGNTAENYDGPLTNTGVDQVRALRDTAQELNFDRVFCGTMLRHKQTAAELGIKATEDSRCGNDSGLFALLEGDETYLGDWREFIEEQKKAGVESMLVIGSRQLPATMMYLQGGGAFKYGHLGQFLACCETLMTSEGANIPMLAQANITYWEV